LGVAVSGGMGRMISELIMGMDTFSDIDPFRIDRFGTSLCDSSVWRACTLAVT
jgi:4-methylaminobutanoate oxidase (formaldehyde-forming)